VLAGRGVGQRDHLLLGDPAEQSSADVRDAALYPATVSPASVVPARYSRIAATDSSRARPSDATYVGSVMPSASSRSIIAVTSADCSPNGPPVLPKASMIVPP
jgi:hypothetical protein